MSDKRKREKLCLISLENKRGTDFKTITAVVEKLAAYGYYFDKVSRVPFNKSEGIVSAFEDGVAHFENIVIVCPDRMLKIISEYFCARLGVSFDALGMLSGEDTNVFILFSDSKSRLEFSDIKRVLDERYGLRYDNTVIRQLGAPSDLLQKALDDAKNIIGEGVVFNVSERYGDCRIEIVYSSDTPKMALDDGVREIVKMLKDYIYAMEDVSLSEQLVRLLKLRRMKICTAESFTGGGVGKRLVDISGVSEVFSEGLNTYSNEAKMNRLGVSELTLSQRGAVSAETAYQMAEGLLKAGNCNVAVSTTGIAGPKSDNTSKPVGLAFIGVGIDGDIAVYKFNLTGDRQTITETAINQALFLTYKRLK